MKEKKIFEYFWKFLLKYKTSLLCVYVSYFANSTLQNEFFVPKITVW